jgi:formate dehydrogenase subunit beta
MVGKIKIQEEVNKIFDTFHVQYVIGYSVDPCGLYTVPFFANKKEEVQQLTFSAFCVNNLAMYLKHYEGNGKIGIIVKGCDSRSVVQLITEKRIPRENLVIIGISCSGVIDVKKLQKKFPAITGPVDISEKNDAYVVTIDGENHQVPKKEIVLEKCLHCEHPTPLLYDVLLGEKKQPYGSEDYTDVTEIESKSLAEKWKFWENQFSRCIRCYACRNICPVCYCKECSCCRALHRMWRMRTCLSYGHSFNAVE